MAQLGSLIFQGRFRPMDRSQMLLLGLTTLPGQYIQWRPLAVKLAMYSRHRSSVFINSFLVEVLLFFFSVFED